MSKKRNAARVIRKNGRKRSGAAVLLCYRSEGRQYGKGEKREGKSKRT